MRSSLITPVISLVAFFLLLFVYTKVFGPIPFSINSVTTTKSDTFNVSGEGNATATPDVALVTVGIQASGQTVKAAQEQINSVINKVSEAIKAQGVEAKDIKTQNYNINPEYDYSGIQKIKGYLANTNLSVKVRQIDKVNSIIDAATQNGANQVGGVSFNIDDKTRLENEAREKAVAEAKSKAENAAKIAGFKLGKIINYSENFGGFPAPIRAMGTLNAVSEKATQIEPGSSEVTVNVILSYEIQ